MAAISPSGLSALPLLTTLDASRNLLTEVSALNDLPQCPQLSSLNLANNTLGACVTVVF